MSLDASVWAWKIEMSTKKGGALKPLKKLVLLSLADRAGEDHCCYPSMQRLERDTGLERKTVLKIISELIEDGFILDTGERKGNTKRVKVYRLIGVNGRETMPTTELLEDEKPAKIVPTTEQFQQRNHSINGTLNSAVVGTLNSAVVGTQNLPMNLPLESKNKKTWICFEKLREEIYLADDGIDFESIMNSKWFEREKRAFEIYNAEKSMSVDLMIYHFADWLINAYKTKYSEKPSSGPSGNSSSPKLNSNRLTEKQIQVFAQKLSHHPEFAGTFSEPGESYDKLAARIAVKLENPAQAKKWESYLKQVGFNGSLQGDKA